MVDGARYLEDVGCDSIIHPIGYDERRGIAARGERMPSPLDQRKVVVEAVDIPVQAVGGLFLEEAIRCPEYGAALFVHGTPVTIDLDSFNTDDGDLECFCIMIWYENIYNGDYYIIKAYTII